MIVITKGDFLGGGGTVRAIEKLGDQVCHSLINRSKTVDY
jgi:hypothetical protein